MLNVWAGYGMGLPQKTDYSGSSHFELGVARRFSGPFEVGVFVRQQKTVFQDKVDFEATGYSETRTYNLDVMVLGGRLNLLLGDSLSLFAAAGISQTASTLGAVSTTAPVPSTLTPGYSGEAPMSFAYRGGLTYELRFGLLGLGAEASYSVSSTDSTAAVTEMAAMAVIRLHFEKVETKNASPVAAPVIPIL